MSVPSVLSTLIKTKWSSTWKLPNGTLSVESTKHDVDIPYLSTWDDSFTFLFMQEENIATCTNLPSVYTDKESDLLVTQG